MKWASEIVFVFRFNVRDTYKMELKVIYLSPEWLHVSLSL